MATESEPHESQPLLHDQTTHATITPLPKAQLTALCIAKLSDPISYSQIFPYINELLMVLHVTDDPSKVGFYSGLVVCIVPIFMRILAHCFRVQDSISSIAQVMTIFQWAKLSGEFVSILNDSCWTTGRCSRSSTRHIGQRSGSRGCLLASWILPYLSAGSGRTGYQYASLCISRKYFHLTVGKLDFSRETPLYSTLSSQRLQTPPTKPVLTQHTGVFIRWAVRSARSSADFPPI